MNILIADSGSTKTEWILVNKEGEKQDYYSKGLNPYFMSVDAMKESISTKVVEPLEGIIVDEIFFLWLWLRH